MKFFTLFIILMLPLSPLFAQKPSIKVTPPSQAGLTTEAILQSLVGEGVIIKSFSTNLPELSHAYGAYHDPKKVMGIEQGILLTTGSVNSVVGPNKKGDMTSGKSQITGINYNSTDSRTCEDLERLLPNNGRTFDATVIEMDIVSVGDTLSFTYVFGSEEYDEFVCSDFNDIFAFFISGPGIEGEQNIAVLPKTQTPVSINNVNNGNPAIPSCQPSNATFYQRSNGQDLEYDGFTRLLEIKQKVTPFETYHLKLAIADVTDNAYDSGVIIEGKSMLSYFDQFSVPFASNDHQLSDNAQLLLDRMLEIMDEKKIAKLQLTGHTDSDGAEALNDALAKRRMNSVVQYLQSKGLSEEDMILINRGESMPIADNFSDEGKTANRRVEIRLLGDEEVYYAEQAAQTRSLFEAAAEAPRLEQNQPNPAVGYTIIPYYVPSNARSAELLVHATNGRLMKQAQLVDKRGGQIRLDTEGWSAGVYVYHLYVDGVKRASEKMMIGR